jgi:lipopolysaccharide export system protein LptA
MKTPLAPLLIALCTAFAGLPAAAEKADRNKPMNIEADALRYDDQKQSSSFTGRVVVTKGSIVMRGARLDVRQDPDGSQFGLLTAEPGQRAFYRQKREGLDEYTEGEAELIEYDSRADRVKLTRRAELRRYRGATLNDQINGTVIVFDNTTEVFTVDGKPGGATPDSASGGRVRAMLTPRSAASAPVGSASAPAAATVPHIVPRLRSSTSLGGERP